MSKSPGFLAIEELLKAQDTHMKLKRQFQEERVKEAIAKRREVIKSAHSLVLIGKNLRPVFLPQAFKEEEFKAKKASEKAMKKFEEKLNKVKAESEVSKLEIEIVNRSHLNTAVVLLLLLLFVLCRWLPRVLTSSCLRCVQRTRRWAR